MSDFTLLGWKISLTLSVIGIISIPFVFLYMEKCKEARFRRQEIRLAILEYQDFCKILNRTPEVFLSDMETYTKTVNRLWDFGNKRILPKEKYNLVKRFIEPVYFIPLFDD